MRVDQPGQQGAPLEIDDRGLGRGEPLSTASIRPSATMTILPSRVPAPVPSRSEQLMNARGLATALGDPAAVDGEGVSGDEV